MAKVCTKCKIDKSFDDFSNSANQSSGLRPYCRVCAKAMKREWYIRNYIVGSPYYKKVQEAGQKRVASGKNAIDCRRMYLKHREKRLAAQKIYKEANRPLVRTWQKMYKARVRGANGFCSPEKLQAKIDYYGAKCWLCNAPYEEIDHVKPVSKGGSNWPVNLRPICKSCNKTKSAKWPLERVFA